MSKTRTTFDLRITCEADDGSTSHHLPPSPEQVRAAVCEAVSGFDRVALTATPEGFEIFVEEATIRPAPEPTLEEQRDEAIELCRWLAEDACKGLGDPGEATCIELPATETDPFRVEVCDANDGGTFAYWIFSVMPNNNPSGQTAFAVLQEEPESGDRWVHLSKTICF